MEARRELGLEDDRPLLLSYWGSLGAEDMDDCMVDFIRAERAAGVPFLGVGLVNGGGAPPPGGGVDHGVAGIAPGAHHKVGPALDISEA